MSKKKIIPQATGDFVIVTPVDSDESVATRGDILIPEVAQDAIDGDALRATIVSVGNKCESKMKPGDTALILKGSCLETTIGSTQYLFCRESRVVGVLS